MINDEDLAELSSDPDEAFLTFERLARRAMEAGKDETWDSELRYVHALHEFGAVYDLAYVNDLPRLQWSNQFGEQFRDFLTRIDALTLRIRLGKAKAAKGGKGPTLEIAGDVREALHFHLGQMRQLLSTIQLPENKREAIFTKLHDIGLEIDTNRTRWESWMSLAIELADTAAEVQDRLDPIQKIFNVILKRLGKAKADAPRLPSPEPRRRIEAPKQLSNIDEGSATLDQDIPF